MIPSSLCNCTKENPAETKNLQGVFPSNFSEVARTQLPVLSGILEVRTLKNARHSLGLLPSMMISTYDLPPLGFPLYAFVQ